MLTLLIFNSHSITCAVNGPLAADISSLAAIYRVLGVPDVTSHFASPAPLLQVPSSSRNKILGVPEAWMSASTPGIQRLCNSALQKLVSVHNYALVPITIPFLIEGQTAHAMTVLTDASTLLPVTKNLTPANKIMLALGTVTPSIDYLLAQKLRNSIMQHLAYLWKSNPGMIIVTPTTSCAGWPIKRGASELRYGVSDGDRTKKTMEYVWMANFTGAPAITVPVGYVVPEGVKGEGEEAEELDEGKIPVGLMGMGEWGAEEDLLGFGADAEELVEDRRVRSPIWVDIIERARAEMKNGAGPSE